jgi:hypothetical protein
MRLGEIIVIDFRGKEASCLIKFYQVKNGWDLILQCKRLVYHVDTELSLNIP